VLFTDDPARIFYRVGFSNIPNYEYPGSKESSYRDIWNAGPEVTAIHAQELSKWGLQTKSIYELLSGSEVAALTGPGSENRAKNYQMEPQVTLELAQALTARNQRYLFWVTWSGLQFIFPRLPLNGVEQISSSYWLFDLETRSLLWSGSLADIRDSSFKYDDAKPQFEDNRFDGLKRIVTQRYRQAYRAEDDTVPWLLGLSKMTGLPLK
jgi:hypothetical protein